MSQHAVSVESSSLLHHSPELVIYVLRELYCSQKVGDFGNGSRKFTLIMKYKLL